MQFSAMPQARAPASKKFRPNDGGNGNGLAKDAANLMWDKRVMRGSTYSLPRKVAGSNGSKTTVSGGGGARGGQGQGPSAMDIPEEHERYVIRKHEYFHRCTLQHRYHKHICRTP